jgi:hypothetical protein
MWGFLIKSLWNATHSSLTMHPSATESDTPVEEKPTTKKPTTEEQVRQRQLDAAEQKAQAERDFADSSERLKVYKQSAADAALGESLAHARVDVERTYGMIRQYHSVRCTVPVLWGVSACNEPFTQ